MRTLRVLAAVITGLVLGAGGGATVPAAWGDSSDPAPYGPASAVWMAPTQGNSRYYVLWKFTPDTNEADATFYQGSAMGGTLQTSRSYTYGVNGSTVTLQSLTTKSLTLELLGYSRGSDVLRVRDGSIDEKWYGCRADNLPLAVTAACASL
ncbi:hypothetical protein GL305_21515 [Nocardia seriolae]|nr:hypothetical protein [Nocardia seriolae]MTJ72448.1 hypothetical protein [Nocardia seriolae]MTJ88474.1 hypothetical protein [Nocardia seriolae]MTK32456.1 hypothetical protein [Nocardia seriolae]MTK49043.1 hypothetical protein [Nocardia seriolae]MTL14029.1 hypothetical protein [Nocardia seriolae]